MASRRLVSDDGTFRTYESLDDSGQVIGTAREQYVFPPEQANAGTIRARIEAQLAPGSALRQITDSSGTLTTAQLSNGLRVVAKAVLGLGKLYLARTADADGT